MASPLLIKIHKSVILIKARNILAMSVFVGWDFSTGAAFSTIC